MSASKNANPDASGEFQKKWGKDVIEIGFSMIPSLLFRAQARLGLKPTQLILILHLVDYWWHKDRLPFPSKSTLAQRMGLTERQIQRYFAELEKAKLIKRKARFAPHKGQQTNEYDLDGLVAKLKKLAPEYAEVRENIREQTTEIEKPGGLARINKKKKVADE